MWHQIHDKKEYILLPMFCKLIDKKILVSLILELLFVHNVLIVNVAINYFYCLLLY